MNGSLSWLKSPLARALFATECTLFKRELPRFQGHFCLHMLPWPTDPIFRPFKLAHQIVALESPIPKVPPTDSQNDQALGDLYYDREAKRNWTAPSGWNLNPHALITDFTALPFRDNSIDVIFLHHCLEFHSAPHSVLREASRVLLPSGALIVVAFNPFSLWGLRRFLLGWRVHETLRWHPITQGRVMDWLTLLDYRVERSRQCMYRWPLQWKAALDFCAPLEGLSRMPWIPGGGVHITMARKQVGGLTPLRPRWVLPRPRRALVSPAPR